MKANFNPDIFLSWLRGEEMDRKDLGLRDQLKAAFAHGALPSVQHILLQAARITAIEVISRYVKEHPELSAQTFNAAQIDSFATMALSFSASAAGLKKLGISDKSSGTVTKPPLTETPAEYSARKSAEFDFQALQSEESKARHKMVREVKEGYKELVRWFQSAYRDMLSLQRVMRLHPEKTKEEALAELADLKKKEEELNEMMEAKMAAQHGVGHLPDQLQEGEYGLRDGRELRGREGTRRGGQAEPITLGFSVDEVDDDVGADMSF